MTVTAEAIFSEFPMADHQASWRHASEVLRTLQPNLTIAIERCGLTEDGTYRNMRGIDVSGYHAKIDYVFREHDCSVGIGDGGNEIGMGNLAAAIPMVTSWTTFLPATSRATAVVPPV